MQHTTVQSATMQVDVAKPSSSAIAKKNHRKKVALSSSVSNNKFTNLYKKVRNTSRPLPEKGQKSARIEQKTAVEDAAKQALLSKLDMERIARLQKLLKRHESAGRIADAETLQKQIDAIRTQ